MNEVMLTVRENSDLSLGIKKLVLEGDVSAMTMPGQFVNLKLDGFFLRRPISVSDWTEDSLTLLYKVVGEGTEALAAYAPGRQLSVLTGLGNGYAPAKSGEKPVLVGGGIGCAPLFRLAKELVKAGKEVTVVQGFNTAREVYYTDEFRALGCRVLLYTADGSAGEKGLVTDGVKAAGGDYIYTCGPEPMLKALYKACELPGQYSFEERMGCGFGACRGCTCKTKTGSKRICKEGPVLDREELTW